PADSVLPSSLSSRASGSHEAAREVRKSSEAPRSSSDSACRTIFSMSLAALGRSCSSPAASPTTVKHISKSCFARASAYALARLPRAIPFGFPVRPLVGELVFQNSKGKLLRPRNTAQSIDRFCANGVVSGGAHAVGSQHHSGSKPSAIGNSSRRKQQRLWRTLRQIIRDFGDKRQRRAGRSVAASFRALCHDGVGSGIERLVHMPQGLHLADQLGLGVMNLGREGLRVTKGKKHAVRRTLQHFIERLRRARSEEHTSELQSRFDFVCRL